MCTTVNTDVLRRRNERYERVLRIASKAEATTFGELIERSRSIQILEMKDILDRLFFAYPDNAIFFFDDLARVADYSASLPLLFDAFSRSTNFFVRYELVGVCTLLIRRDKDRKLTLSARADLIDRLSTMVSMLSIDTSGLSGDLIRMSEDRMTSAVFFFAAALHAPEKRAFLPRLLESTTLNVPAKLLALRPIISRHRADGIDLIRTAFDLYKTWPENDPDRVARTEILTALQLVARTRLTELTSEVESLKNDPNPAIVRLVDRILTTSVS